MKIREYEYNLDLGEVGDCFCDYNNGDIYDIMFEIADNHVDLYNHDLLKWLSDNLAFVQYLQPILGYYSLTTSRHINEFLKQNGFSPLKKKDYEKTDMILLKKGAKKICQ